MGKSWGAVAEGKPKYEGRRNRLKNFDLIPNYENLKNTFLNIGG